MKPKETWKAKAILRKKKVWSVTLSDFKLQYLKQYGTGMKKENRLMEQTQELRNKPKHMSTNIWQWSQVY